MKDLFKFIGKDGSSGLKKDKIYLLSLTDYANFNDNEKYAKEIYVLEKGIYISYSSWETFLENWKRVK